MLPEWGVPESFSRSGTACEGSSGSLERVFPRRGGAEAASAGPGRAGQHGSGPGPARAGRAQQPSLWQPRSPSSQRPEATGPRLPALRPLLGPSHAVRSTRAVDTEGRLQALSRCRASRGSSAQSFSLTSSFQRGQSQGARLACQRRSESVPTQPGRDSARARLPGHVHNFAPPLSGAGQREQTLLSLPGQGSSRPR